MCSYTINSDVSKYRIIFGVILTLNRYNIQALTKMVKLVEVFLYKDN